MTGHDPSTLDARGSGMPSEQADPGLAAVLRKAIDEASVAVHTVTAAGESGGKAPPADDPGAAIAAAVGKTTDDLIYGATDFGTDAAMAALRVVGADRDRLLEAYRSIALGANDPVPDVTPIMLGGHPALRVSGLEPGDGPDDPVMYVYAAGDVVYQIFPHSEITADSIVRRLPDPDDLLPVPPGHAPER